MSLNIILFSTNLLTILFWLLYIYIQIIQFWQSTSVHVRLSYRFRASLLLMSSLLKFSFMSFFWREIDLLHGYTPPFIKLPCYKKGIVAKGNNHPLICHAVDIKYRIYTKVIGNWKIVRFHTQTKFSQMLQVGGKRYLLRFN